MIDMSEAIFFDLFTTAYDFLSSNYKKPIACINKFKPILNNSLSLSQQIFLLNTLQDCFESDEAWNDRDHPQLLTIIYHLQFEQARILRHYLSSVKKVDGMTYISTRDYMFIVYLHEKGIVTKEEKDALINFKVIDDDTSVSTEVTEYLLDGTINTLHPYFTSEGKKVIPYILENYQNVKPGNGLTALVIALESFSNLLTNKITERGKQMAFHSALTENLGKIGTLAAFNLSLANYQSTVDFKKKTQINKIKQEIVAILHPENQHVAKKVF